MRNSRTSGRTIAWRAAPLGMVLMVLLLLGSLIAVASASTFINGDAITIPTSGSDGRATPYPSGISVSGLKGTIIDVNATISGFSHGWANDVDILLVGPHGQSTVLLADAGGASDPADVELTFDDAAAGEVPIPIVSGTFKPTNLINFEGGSPAPAGPYGATLAEFTGTGANGTWNLFVFDDVSIFDGGSIGSWSLDITTDKHSRSVKIRFQGARVKGAVAVRDGYTACASSVPVAVQYRDGSTWRNLGKTTTSATGRFAVGGASESTKYRAIAKPKSLAGHSCLKAISNRLVRR